MVSVTLCVTLDIRQSPHLIRGHGKTQMKDRHGPPYVTGDGGTEEGVLIIVKSHCL